MKKTFYTLIPVILMLASSQSFAYGPRFSNGKGIECAFSISARVKNRTFCAVHVTSERDFSGGSGVDYKGHPYKTVIQTIDNSECFETSISGSFATIHADVAPALKSDLSGYHEVNANSFVKYNNDRGTIDAEERGDTRFYIYKEPQKTEAYQDQQLIRRIFQNIVKAASIEYNDQAKQLTLKTIGLQGTRSFIQPANFAKGERLQAVTFNVPVNVSDELSASREFTAIVRCSPLLEPKK